MHNGPMTTTEQTHTQDIYKLADELEAKADMIDSALLAPSLKSDSLRAEAKHLREMAR
jgi:hypothetical protein